MKKIILAITFGALLIGCKSRISISSQDQNVFLDDSALCLLLPNTIFDTSCGPILLNGNFYDYAFLVDSFYNKSQQGGYVKIFRISSYTGMNYDDSFTTIYMSNIVRKALSTPVNAIVYSVSDIKVGNNNKIGVAKYYTHDGFFTVILVMHPDKSRYYEITVYSDNSEKGKMLREQIPVIINSIKTKEE